MLGTLGPKLVIMYGILITSLMIISFGQEPKPAYGHGLSNDEALPVAIGERMVTAAVTMNPPFLDQRLDEGTIQIRLKDASTDATIQYATFSITMEKDGRTLLSDQFHTYDGELLIVVKPADTDSPTISAKKLQLGWLGTKDFPAQIEAPIFLDGGLYHYRIELLTMETAENLLDPPAVFDAYVSIGEEARHAVTVEGSAYDFGTRTYFDKISDFVFDDDTNIIRFTMPLDWDRNFLAQIPLLHIEALIPKSASPLMVSSYMGTLNGVELPRKAIMIDDSDPDTRIVHYMIVGDRLNRIANEAGIAEAKSTAVFTLESSDVPNFPLDTLSNNERFKMQLTWDPPVIEPGQTVKFIFNIRDPATDGTLTNSYYEFVLLKDGGEIYRNARTAAIGAEVERFTFSEEHAGSVVVRFENINHSGEFTEYLIFVVPEFPGGALVVLAGLAVGLSIVAASRSKRLFYMK